MLGGPLLLTVILVLLQAQLSAPTLPWKILSGAAAFVMKAQSSPTPALLPQQALRGNCASSKQEDTEEAILPELSHQRSPSVSPSPNGAHKKRRGRPPIHKNSEAGSKMLTSSMHLARRNTSHSWGDLGKGAFGEVDTEKDAEWDMYFNLLKEYREKESTCNPPKKSELGLFLRRQRALFKRGHLDLERQKKLVDLGVRLHFNGKVFHRNFQNYKMQPNLYFSLRS